MGGHAPIKMTDLKAAFERMGFQDVRTVLASGNVIFKAGHADKKALAAEIEARLKATLKTDIKVMVRERDGLDKLRSANPFKGIPDDAGLVTNLPQLPGEEGSVRIS